MRFSFDGFKYFECVVCCMVNPVFSMFSEGEEYRVRTPEGNFSGTYSSRETSNGFKFFYFYNGEDSIRMTLVVHEERGHYWVDVTGVGGRHRVFARMVPFTSIDALTTG